MKRRMDDTLVDGLRLVYMDILYSEIVTGTPFSNLYNTVQPVDPRYLECFVDL